MLPQPQKSASAMRCGLRILRASCAHHMQINVPSKHMHARESVYMSAWMHGCMGGWVGGRVGGWMDGWMDGWMVCMHARLCVLNWINRQSRLKRSPRVGGLGSNQTAVRETSTLETLKSANRKPFQCGVWHNLRLPTSAAHVGKGAQTSEIILHTVTGLSPSGDERCL